MKKIFGLVMVVGIMAGFQSAKADPDTLLRSVQRQQLASRCQTEACYSFQIAMTEYKRACDNAQASRQMQMDPVANKFPEPIDCRVSPILKEQRTKVNQVISKYNLDLPGFEN